MRGKAAVSRAAGVEVGITPAYAGKRLVVNMVSMHLKDHPRLCGEKGDLEIAMIPESGSPPPMRGKAVPYTRKICLYGITPAYAGKSLHL